MRGLGLVAVALVGCYAPSPAAFLACAAADSPARCPAGQTCIVRGSTEVCAPDGTPSDVDGGLLDAPDGPASDGPPSWWNPAWKHRRPIDVTAGTNGAPAGYSLAITIDHHALVLAGASSASGNDVRIVRDDGTELDRVLDSGASWDTTATKLWFKSGAALTAGGTQRYWVYWGNTSAGVPPQSATTVFLFSDGFEGALTSWSFDTGVVASTARAHRGTHSLMTPSTTNASAGGWVGAINQRDVVWDVWANIDVITNVDLSIYVRGASGSTFLTNLQPSGGASRWNIAKNTSSNYVELVPAPSGGYTPPADTWVRMTIYAYSDKMAVDINGTRYVPTSGFTNVADTSTGDVGIDTWLTMAPVYFDDVSARRFVLPEPTAVIGLQESLP